MTAPFTSKQAKESIAGRIITVVGAGPKVYDYNCLDYKVDKDGKPDFSEWPGMFTYGDDGEFIHGWVVKRVDLGADLRMEGCQDKTWFFEVTGFYGFKPERTETAPGAFTSSDDEWDQIVDNVADEINSSSLITINSLGVLHYGIQFKTTVMRAGQQLLHYAGGLIEIEFQT